MTPFGPHIRLKDLVRPRAAKHSCGIGPAPQMCLNELLDPIKDYIVGYKQLFNVIKIVGIYRSYTNQLIAQLCGGLTAGSADQVAQV
jgi:hypothetical protein